MNQEEMSSMRLGMACINTLYLVRDHIDGKHPPGHPPLGVDEVRVTVGSVLEAIESLDGAAGATHFSAEDHHARHRVLHAMFDELLGDYLAQTKRHLYETTVLDLLTWSSAQCDCPAEIAK